MPLSVDAQFTSLMNDMMSFSEKISEYTRNGLTQRRWMVPYSSGWTFQPYDPTTMGEPFDRSGPNNEYMLEYTGSGSNEIRAVMGTHIEINYMGMMERAFRERHRTSTRAAQLLAGRRLAHSLSSGVHKVSVEGYISDLFNA